MTGLRILCLFLCTLVTPTFAQTESLPALFDVSGVSEGDVLNVRTGPGTEHPVIAGLEPTATNIEMIRVNNEQSWGLINLGESTGWVSLEFLTRQPGQWTGQAPKSAQCFGTEPFWSFKYTPDELVFSQVDALPLTFTPAADLKSRNQTDRHMKVYENTLGGLVLTLRNAACNDGMSDRAFGWDADLMLIVAGSENAQMFSGCCSIAP